MSLHPLVLAAVEWAAAKSRTFDADLMSEALDLRRTYDDLGADQWPSGSAERLLLVTWPAYGPEPPGEEVLSATLDAYWMFLRATGRMSARSASPADLRKELRRALPRMRAAYDDPARHSQGRILADFGRSVGIDLDGASTNEELQRRLQAVQDAWNALPLEDRVRRMPDPSSKGLKAQAWTAEAVAEAPEPDEMPFPPGDEAAAARDVIAAPFVQQCFALADWVGRGRPVTQAGLLRPAVAREAYQALGLWPWERALDALEGRSVPMSVRDIDQRDVDAAFEEAALHSWRSAGDCIPLDRLWFSAVEAGLIELGSTRATRVSTEPTSDEEWRYLGLRLVAALFRRLGTYRVEPLVGLLALPAIEGRPVAMTEVRARWDEQLSVGLRDKIDWWQHRLDRAVLHFADCGMFVIDEDRVAVTDLGRDCLLVLAGLLEDGELDHD